MERTWLALCLAAALATASTPAGAWTFEFEAPTLDLGQFTKSPVFYPWSRSALPTTELFGGEGPRASDVIQGYELNCHLLSALAAIAAYDPDQIRDMIRGPFKDGSYSVRFFALDPATGCPGGDCTWDAIPTHEVWINVMPTFELYRFSLALDSDEDGVDEIWAPLIEKAYVEYIARYWSSRDEYAYGFIALAALGWPATWDHTTGSISALWRVLSSANAGFPVLAGTTDPQISGSWSTTSTPCWEPYSPVTFRMSLSGTPGASWSRRATAATTESSC